jgi:hypothetical protein
MKKENPEPGRKDKEKKKSAVRFIRCSFSQVRLSMKKRNA